MEALRVIPGFGSKSVSKSDLSAKDKRYLSNVEKALATFDSLQEWADYIAFLSRLQKALSLGDESVESQSIEWIPLSDQVSKKLALCLSPKLPNGVHQKALSIYESIFTALTKNAFDAHVNEWLPGFVPVISYASMQLKPKILEIYRQHIISKLNQDTIKTVVKPLMLSLLAVLDDENSEVYKDAFALMDSFKSAMNDNSLFWQTLFVCITTSPERRLGALNWCVARLPSFKSFKDKDGHKLSAEANACLRPEPGLLVRAFAAAIDTKTSFNSANDIIVIRGFFDLLLSHLPLSSDVFQHDFTVADRELLIMASCKITLKKDMSLNRRLWNWLIGPETSEEGGDGDAHVTYFADHALPILSEGVLKLVNSKDHGEKIQGLKIALSFMLDRWEISQLVAPRFFTSILQSCYLSFKTNAEGSDEILANTKLFFDAVEARIIWEYIICTLILSESTTDFEMLRFLLRNFDFHDQEVATHIPLAMLCLLMRCELSKQSVEALELLSGLAQPRLFAPLKNVERKDKESFLEEVQEYYEGLNVNDAIKPPIDGTEMSFMLLDNLKDWYVQSVDQDDLNDKVSSILCHFLFTIPTENYEVFHFSDRVILDTVLKIKPYSFGSDEIYNQKTLNLVLGAVKFTRYLVKASNTYQRNKILKIILSNLWYALVSPYPANNEVEAVKIIFDLELSFESHEIEAGLVEMLIHTPQEYKAIAFYKLWTHSSDLSAAESLLAGPLHLILDDLLDTDPANVMAAQRLVRNIIRDGSAVRFLKLLTNPLLSFSILKSESAEVNYHDDLKLFAYNVQTIHKVIQSNEKLLKEAFNHEFVVSESTETFELLKSNDWEVSNYKSFVCAVLHKFLSLRLSSGILQNKKALKDYANAVSSTLELFADLVIGSEADFEVHFLKLVQYCLYYVQQIDPIPFEIELVEAEYINIIMHFLDLTKSMNVDLSLLHTAADSKDPILVTFIIEGIKKCSSSILLEKWFVLLTRSLYSFNESVFSVIMTLNDGIITKVRGYLNCVKEFGKANDFTNLESSFSILLSGLEDMLSISHSYLLTSSLRSNAKAAAANGESGFLGNMISGVFSIESPNLRTEEQNKIYSILISIQDASKMAFEIWDWAERASSSSAAKFASTKSVVYLSNKLRFRSRKLLEALMDLERQEVIETIIETSSEKSTKLKLLHVLDNGRPQITLPHIINSIVTRCYPSILDENKKSSMNSPVTSKQLSEFLVPYLESVDSDTIEEVWVKLVSFFRDVLAHAFYFRDSLSDFLRALVVLATKGNTRKSSDRKGHGKEVADLFVRMINAACTIGMAEDSEKHNEHSAEDLLKTLTQLIESVQEVIQDSDKTTSVVNTIVNVVLAPQLKLKSKKTEDALALMTLIGKVHATKAWKTTVNDFFVDNNFFKSRNYQLDGWKNLIGVWAANDKDAAVDLISRISPPTKSTAANIFVWSENSEVEDKVYILKRLSYLIVVLPRDQLSNVLEDLFSRLFEVINGSCPALFKCEAFLLLRAVTVKYDQLHLLSTWEPITQGLVEVFASILSKSQKDLGQLGEDDAQLVLSACKLLDQLLLIGFDEFTLKEWLFVETNPAAVTDSTKQDSTSLIDLLAKSTANLSVKSSAVQVTHPTPGLPNKPTLYGVQKIESIGSLRRFFDSFSYINYERSYSLAQPNLEECCSDILQDLSTFN
ncbi:hypothetical protein FT663_02102 [Candidozyma haemuli var. vulneris]|nr:hypothetical protein FT662_03266 [[Candida] haemuloni var. vulneris]KAF3992943.1 hypothetical protein FT663_02102 [[Candida] haemuloni var. vulneris]